MRIATLVWIIIVTLCVRAIVQEGPNIGLNLRYRRGIGSSAKDHPLQAMPDSLIEKDREAGEMVRFRLAYDLKDPKLDQLRPLVAEYPENEFFLSRLAEGLIETDGVELPTVLEVVDRLLAINPDNAHYRYLRGWAILEARANAQYLDEAVAEFELGHALPEFYLPSSEYKARVDAMYSKAAFRYYDRRKIYPFYWDLANLISPLHQRKRPYTGQSLRRITDAAVVMATRLIDHAYDLDSLGDGRVLLEGTEKARLEELELTADEAGQARCRLAQAIALDEMDRDWHPSRISDGLISASLMPFSVLLYTAVASLGLFVHQRNAAVGSCHWRGTPAGVCLTGLLLLLLLLTTLLFQGRALSAQTVMSTLFAGGVLFWTGYLAALAFIGPPDLDGWRRARLWTTVAYILLWLNGVLLLLAGTGGFPGCTGASEWAYLAPFLRFWTPLCGVLLWVAILDRRPLLGRIPCHLGLLGVLGFATFLMTFEIFAAQWRRVDRAYADPLSFYQPLPKAARETYERCVRDGGPPIYIPEEKKADALPAYLEYFTPEDMEAFLLKWHAEGKTISGLRRWGLLQSSARDVRPIVRRVLAEWDDAGSAQWNRD